jgi:hypothetical protein
VRASVPNVEHLDGVGAAARAPHPSPQARERQLSTVALAQRGEVEMTAVAAGVAVRVELVAFAKIADRSDRHGALAPIARHGQEVFLFCSPGH